MHLSAVLLINLDLQTVAFRTRGQKRQENHRCVTWITHLPQLPCASQWHPSIFNYWKVFNLVCVRAEYDELWRVVCAAPSVFLTTDAVDVGGNSKIIASTTSRIQCWESSVEEGRSGKGNKIGGEWFRLVKAALWKNAIPEETAFWSWLNTDTMYKIMSICKRLYLCNY